MRRLRIAFLNLYPEVIYDIKKAVEDFYEIETEILPSVDYISASQKYDAIIINGKNLTRITSENTPIIVFSDTKDPETIFNSFRELNVRDWITKDEIYRLPSVLYREILWSREKKLHNLNIRYIKEYSQTTGLLNFDGFIKKLRDMTDKDLTVVAMEINHRIPTKTRKTDILQKVSDIILENIKSTDVLAHIEENKFALATEEIISVEKIINRIQNNLQSLNIELNAGASIYPHDSDQIYDIIKNSETALRKAKNENKILLFYNREISEELERLDKLIEKLQKIKTENIEDFFTLHYQPIFNMKNQEIFGYEELLRVKHAEIRYFDIPKILQIADDLKILKFVEEWVIYKAIKQAKKLEKQGRKISINVSPKFISSTNLPRIIEDALKYTHTSPNSIILEITEDSQIDEDKKEDIEKIRELGVSITIDDFGTKYNTFRFLKSMPIDIVKLDHELTKHIPESKEENKFVSAIIKFCHDIGKLVIVEGIEKNEQLKFFKESRSDFGQGFLLGPPMSEEEILGKENKKVIKK